jgi:hypothetical protein
MEYNPMVCDFGRTKPNSLMLSMSRDPIGLSTDATVTKAAKGFAPFAGYPGVFQQRISSTAKENVVGCSGLQPHLNVSSD